MHITRMLVYGVLLIASMTLEARAQDSLETAARQWESHLMKPETSFGGEVSDSLTGPAGEYVSKRDFSFYVADEKVHHQFREYSLSDPASLFQTVITIKSEEKGRDTTKIGRLNHAHDSKRLEVGTTSDSFAIGEMEVYQYGNEEYNARRADKNPYQMLVNPAFAPLKITPEALLREFEVEELPDENGNKSYKLTRDLPGKKQTLSLVVSPKWGNMVVKSVLEQTWLDGNEFGMAPGKTRQEMREVRSAERCQNGAWAATEFNYQEFEDGKLLHTLARKLTGIRTGNQVGDELFDFNEQLNYEWDSVTDAKTRLRLDLVKPPTGVAEALNEVPAATSPPPASGHAEPAVGHDQPSDVQPGQQGPQPSVDQSGAYSLYVPGIIIALIGVGVAAVLVRKNRKGTRDGVD